jgi:hypothetical protein
MYLIGEVVECVNERRNSKRVKPFSSLLRSDIKPSFKTGGRCILSTTYQRYHGIAKTLFSHKGTAAYIGFFLFFFKKHL